MMNPKLLALGLLAGLARSVVTGCRVLDSTSRVTS